ncbi:MAG: hypothetical protein ACLRR6_04710 [Oscillospiraceae bacterium]
MKQYQKPEVFYENFVLAEHIAQCNYTINAADVMNCEIVKDNVGGFLAIGPTHSSKIIKNVKSLVSRIAILTLMVCFLFSSPNYPLWNRSLSPSQAVRSAC